MPGATLESVDGDRYLGMVRLKVGPITAQYRGEAQFERLDADSHVAVLRASGREAKGQGNATATITARLSSEAGGTTVDVNTDLAITGKAAQFGRGVLAEVSSNLLDQFVERLETIVLGNPDDADETQAPAGASDASVGDPPASLDLLATAGLPIARRLAPVVLVLALVWWFTRAASSRR